MLRLELTKQTNTRHDHLSLEYSIVSWALVLLLVSGENSPGRANSMGYYTFVLASLSTQVDPACLAQTPHTRSPVKRSSFLLLREHSNDKGAVLLSLPSWPSTTSQKLQRTGSFVSWWPAFAPAQERALGQSPEPSAKRHEGSGLQNMGSAGPRRCLARKFAGACAASMERWARPNR